VAKSPHILTSKGCVCKNEAGLDELKEDNASFDLMWNTTLSSSMLSTWEDARDKKS